ncbi:MBL fold metallo-hydrolase [Peptostreptococcus equinus]|uniref:MBL fold metallo-hydrolase n=1 Tax=Peptostreptococcus equinus TaxID=3003601 RepID=A0ABY7JQB6_9FIRM|nr:MBL fold metallo-hydrolase [Peptostreptococcus sp. CBA3647]WAW14147.1 MBL fold metallo-hydrolase [Peptostreptococcus sp. CBA3647]
MKLTYIYHSCFLLEFEDRYLLFDYYKKDLPKMNLKKKLYVFSSHVHKDHFNKNIFNIFNKHMDVEYILSDDIQYRDYPKYKRVHYVSPNSKYKIGDMDMQTLTSTDEGVAFLINVNGKSIYYAGDLNWWTWDGFESEKEYEDMTNRFKHEIDKIKGLEFDLAMVPLDPRQGDRYDWGMKYFLENTKTKNIAPMHCWDKYEVIDRFREDNSEISKDINIIDTNLIKDGIDL